MRTIVLKNEYLNYLIKEQNELYCKFIELDEFQFNYDVRKCKFSIFIGDKVNNTIKFNLQYILSDNHSFTNDCVEYISGKDALIMSLKKAFIDLKNATQNVLLYLGKFPESGIDLDGGSILAKQLINILKIRCNLDLAFIRKNNEEYYDPFVNNIYYYEYIDPFNNKFIRRLENCKTNNDALKKYKLYDKIVVAHISKLFGCDFGDEFWNKIILFPMFCTHSYIRAGEFVPTEYYLQEKKVLERVKMIITPSIEEKEDLIKEYNVKPNKIHVVYRGISPYIKYRIHKRIENPVRIICIGSIKKQKNNIMQLQILNSLIKNNICAKMHIVTTVQDKKIYNELVHYIEENNLKNYIQFHFSISQKELSFLLNESDINLSTSYWETFGRGIFEGISAGLPTLVSDKLVVVRNIVGNNLGVKFLKSVSDYMTEIIKLLDESYYNRSSRSLKTILNKISYKSEQIELCKLIFFL